MTITEEIVHYTSFCVLLGQIWWFTAKNKKTVKIYKHFTSI